MLALLLSISASAEDSIPAYLDLLPTTTSFESVKKKLYETVSAGHTVTFYCGCAFNPTSKNVDLASCSMQKVESTRAKKVEAEHVVPASTIGASRPCWEEGGRAHCLKTDPIFAKAHNDLHNLQPAVGAINGARSNFRMGLIEGENREYGECDFELDLESELAEPAPNVRGDIARTYFYMEHMYGVALSEGQRRLFLHWHQQDPVDDWERQRNIRIKGIQGNLNSFID